MEGINSYKDLRKEVKKEDSKYAKFQDIVREIDELKDKDKTNDVINENVINGVLSGELKKHLINDKQVAKLLFHEIRRIDINKLDQSVKASVINLRNNLGYLSYYEDDNQAEEMKLAWVYFDWMESLYNWIKTMRDETRNNIQIDPWDGTLKSDVKPLYDYINNAENGYLVDFENYSSQFENHINKIVVDSQMTTKNEMLAKANNYKTEFGKIINDINTIYSKLPDEAVKSDEQGSTNLINIDKKWNNIDITLVNSIKTAIWEDKCFLSLDGSGNLSYDSEKLNNFLNSINEDNFWDYWKVDRSLHIICDRTNWKAMNIAVQILFNEKDNANLTVNGFWQPNSEYYNKIKDYQKTNTIEPADGKLNFTTFNQLCSSRREN